MAGAEAADEVVAGHWQSAVRGSAGVEESGPPASDARVRAAPACEHVGRA